MIKPEKLRKQIEAAFANVPYPGDHRITDHPCTECEEVARTFKGQEWQDWLEDPFTLLNNPKNLYGFISLFTPEAFRYYLPLFMIAHLINWGRASTYIDTVLSKFVKPTKNPQQAQKEFQSQQEHYDSYMRLFDSSQIDAIRAFLAYEKERSGEDIMGFIKNSLKSLEEYPKDKK